MTNEFIKAAIEEYKREGHLNIYFLGREGSGRTTLLFQIYKKLCDELNFKPDLEFFDFNNQILSQKGLNLIKTFKDSNSYKFKIKTIINYNEKGFKKGFCEYSYKNNILKSKFPNKNEFYNKYLEKKREFIESSLYN